MPLILTVCTGNICRSPIAAHVLQGYLGASVTVSSAGTRAVVGAPVDAPMLRAAGLLPTAIRHEASQLRAESIEAADLVIAMAAEHRAAVVSLVPSALGKVVTLDELAVAASLALAGTEGVPSTCSVADAGRTIAAARHLITRHGIVDIPDPYGRSDAVYQRAFTRIDERCRAIAAWLVGDVGGTDAGGGDALGAGGGDALGAGGAAAGRADSPGHSPE